MKIQVHDPESRPLIQAAYQGHVEDVKYLLQCDWSSLGRKNEALQQAIVTAAAAGHEDVLEYLLNVAEYEGKVGMKNNVDSLFGETALTAACLGGRYTIIRSLLQRQVDLEQPNGKGETPLLCAAKAGICDVADCLLTAGALLEQRDSDDRTPLMVAACEGHIGLLEFLLEKGACTTAQDRKGMTALSWASLRGYTLCAKVLIESGSAIDHSDMNGRCPLDFAASSGEPRLVQYLLDHGADCNRIDGIGMRPVDRAIGSRHGGVIACFLKKGAKLGKSAWAMATGKPDILFMLLKKLLEDGVTLYKKDRVKAAAHRFAYALGKFSPDTQTDAFSNLEITLMLNLSRCLRKLGDFTGARELATNVLKMRPGSHEAYYARARAERDTGNYREAIGDLTEAQKLAPNNREIGRLLLHVKREWKTDDRTRYSPLESLKPIVEEETVPAESEVQEYPGIAYTFQSTAF